MDIKYSVSYKNTVVVVVVDGDVAVVEDGDPVGLVRGRTAVARGPDVVSVTHVLFSIVVDVWIFRRMISREMFLVQDQKVK